MSKPLEALKELKQKRFYSNGVGVDLEDSYPELFDIIEKALTKLDKIENAIHNWGAGKYGFSHEANALHIKDIQNILKEKENEKSNIIKR